VTIGRVRAIVFGVCMMDRVGQNHICAVYVYSSGQL
jgi:hypothetical protein